MSQDTPSLSELVRSAILKREPELRTFPPALLNNIVEAAIEAFTLSRLSGDGGGAATPSASLEEDAKLAAAKFASMILDAYWPDCNDIDGAEIQELGIKSGVMQEVPGGYDPEKHGESIYDAEPGDTWYVAHPGLALLTSSAAPQAQAASPPNLEPQCGVGVSVEAVTAACHAFFKSCGAWPGTKHMETALQAASAAVPKPIDDGAVERVVTTALNWGAAVTPEECEATERELALATMTLREKRAALQASGAKT